MSISVFLSYPQPHMKNQENFINEIKSYLKYRGLEPRTLGVTDYDTNEPLTAIRRLMLESNGMLTIAFRRALIEKGVTRPNSDNGKESTDLLNSWTTSPWCHIEPAMAFQIGLPILILREQGVLADGVLEKGVTGTYLPEFSLYDPIDNYLKSEEWNQIIGIWEGYVRTVVKSKGFPPKLY